MTDMTTTMNRNHLSFPSKDVLATVAFFEKHLDCTVTARNENTCILNHRGFDIVIEDVGEHEAEWPHNFHRGFELATVEEVRELYHRFKADRIAMQSSFFKHARGSRFFCQVPGGFSVEINTRADADVPYRGTFNNLHRQASFVMDITFGSAPSEPNRHSQNDFFQTTETSNLKGN